MKEWSAMKKLIWLKRAVLSAASAILKTVSGVAPLLLGNAVANPIHSLTQYGKCTQSGTPTPDAPVDIMTNNGALKYGKSLTLDPTRYYAYIGTSNAWSYSTDSFSIIVPVTVGKKYKITADPTTPIDGSVQNVILRWGFVDTVYDDWKRSDVLPSSTSVTIYDWVRSTPQDTQSVEVTATHPFMVVQMGALAFASNLTNGRIGVEVQEIYCGGTHPGQNLVDLTAVTDGYYYDTSGVYTAIPVARLTDYIPVKSGQKYTVYVKAASSGSFVTVRCNLFDSAQVWKSQSSFTVTAGSENVGVVTPAEDGFLRVSANYTGTGAQADWSVLQIVRGEYTLATMPPYEPYEEIPYEPEVLTVSGKNLINPDAAGVANGYYITDAGVQVYDNYSFLSDYIPVVEGETYTAQGVKSLSGSANLRVHGFNASKAWTEMLAKEPMQQNEVVSATFVVPSGVKYVRVCGYLTRATGRDAMLELGSTATSYEPYTAQTVTDIPALLSVGDTKDEAEIISGLLTHRIGIKVFDGTENWRASSSANIYILDSAIAVGLIAICTHFVKVPNNTSAANMQDGTFKGHASNSVLYFKDESAGNVNGFKAFLAAQYAAGMPVIVLYKLATETTEQITAQHLVTHEGANIVDAASNVDPVELKAEYYATE